MTRSFSLRDLALLWALRDQGITLDMQRAALYESRPLQEALCGLMPARAAATLTYVCHGHAANGRGFIQVQAYPERQEWQVVHLAPRAEAGGLSWGPWWACALSELCVLAGRRGALRVRAGVAAGSLEEEVFRQAGFSAYTREEVYRLLQPGALAGRAAVMRNVTAGDAWRLLQLVGQVVPPPVQHAEGLVVSGADVPILARLGVSRERGYVLERGEELGAYLGLSRSRRGVWARILLHPDDGSRAPEVIGHAIAAAAGEATLYCAVRDYQAGLRNLMQDMGFEFVGVQVWLVRHTARPAVSPNYRQLAAREKRPGALTTPLHPVNTVALVPCLPVTREHWTYEY